MGVDPSDHTLPRLIDTANKLLDRMLAGVVMAMSRSSSSSSQKRMANRLFRLRGGQNYCDGLIEKLLRLWIGVTTSSTGVTRLFLCPAPMYCFAPSCLSLRLSPPLKTRVERT